MTNPTVPAWLGRARETLKDAQLLWDAGRLDACVNRLYYACFYAATALLLSRGQTSSKHTGVRGLLHRHFVQSGEMPRNLARTYNTLFDSRLQSDYQVLPEFTAEEVSPLLEGAEQFIAWVEEALTTDGESNAVSDS